MKNQAKCFLIYKLHFKFNSASTVKALKSINHKGVLPMILRKSKLIEAAKGSIDE
jgi:hypothetical protein